MNQFEWFLKRHGVYNEFIDTFSKLNNRDAKKYIENNNCFDAIFWAFCWGDTKRGEIFWSNINNEWEKLWNKIKSRLTVEGSQ